ncbi:hypothetical protein CCO03_17265 [Comamonas serinivorans]|uniref:Bacterial sugar transferase domain-containing protein n=1 Tax=Comamonas serinivorans TaxID=1082851 RepID=A0A1Y0ERZ0_9BURK|nr:sugar transferase [Comamonas serinivorans]ARU06190.1 hypothetical protein CCO03_17265 [Comamonas serinivorans]
MAKRAFDWIVSSLALLLLAPVLALVAVAVRLDSPGPVLFRQQRVGLQGRLFWIHKFRSMRWQPAGLPAAGPQVTAGSDARITRVGRWLRRSKLDELPQLWDVWRGAMSLVGPRPEVPRFMACYAPAVRAQILSVRPGITDWAAVAFRDEERLLAQAADPELAYVQAVMPIKQAYYLQYVATRSLAGDLRILWATACAVLGVRVALPDVMNGKQGIPLQTHGLSQTAGETNGNRD